MKEKREKFIDLANQIDSDKIKFIEKFLKLQKEKLSQLLAQNPSKEQIIKFFKETERLFENQSLELISKTIDNWKSKQGDLIPNNELFDIKYTKLSNFVSDMMRQNEVVKEQVLGLNKAVVVKPS